MKSDITNTLAAKINTEHGKALDAAKTAISHAVNIGAMLTDAKSHIDHGGWLAWVEKNLSFGDRQASKYMRLAKDKDAIEANRNSDSDLSIDDALKLLAPRPSKREREQLPFPLPGIDSFLLATPEHGRWLAAITPVMGKSHGGIDGVWYNLEIIECNAKDGGGVETFSRKPLHPCFISGHFNAIPDCYDWESAEWEQIPHHGGNYAFGGKTRMERLGF